MSTQTFTAENFNDVTGRPAGGYVRAKGIAIRWQDGPLGRVGSDERIEPNGAFVETVLEAAKQRIEYYQRKFPCRENADAIVGIKFAIGSLNARTYRRVEQNVEGTHEGS